MRLTRVESLLRQTIASILQHKIANPKIGFVSITGVSVTKDIATAHVYYSQIGTDDEKRQTYFALKRSAKFIKGELGKEVRLKTIPNLVFKYDPSLERGVSMVNKLNKLTN